MNRLRARAQEILSQYTGFPDLPAGRPCGVLGYTVANAVRRIRHPSRPGPGPQVAVPYLDPHRSTPCRIYYAVIETNPAGVFVASLPKGAQDVRVSKGADRFDIDLGHRHDVESLLVRLGMRPPEPLTAEATADAQALHLDMIETLLRQGYDVEMETPYDAAVRETREENGFDLERSMPDVRRLDLFVEPALSKRRRHVPVEHFIYAAHVPAFDGSVLRHTSIVEKKDTARLGNRYVEFGSFLALDDMRNRLDKARATVDEMHYGKEFAQLELDVTQDRLDMLARIESAICESLPELLVTPPVGQQAAVPVVTLIDHDRDALAVGYA